MSTTTRDRGAVRSEREAALDADSLALTTTHKAAMGLAAVTGLIHLYLGVVAELPIFILAAAGFFFGIGALFMLSRPRRVYLYVLGILFTAGQIAIWLAVGAPNLTFGIPDKLAQVALIALLVVLIGKDREAVTQPR